MKIATHQPHLDHGVGAFNAADVAEPTVVPPPQAQLPSTSPLLLTHLLTHLPHLHCLTSTSTSSSTAPPHLAPPPASRPSHHAPQMDTDHLLHLNDKIDASTAAILDLANSSATMEHLLFDIHHTFATLGLEGSHLDASHLTDLFSHLEHTILSQCKGGTQPSSAALSSSPGATPGAAEGAPSLAATPLSPETIRSLSEETAAAARRAIADLKPEIASPLAEIKTKLESEAATLSAAVKQAIPDPARSLIPHIPHPTLLTPHPSPHIPHPSSLTPHLSPLIPHLSPRRRRRWAAR